MAGAEIIEAPAGGPAGRTRWSEVWRRLRQDRLALAGAIVILIFFLIAALAPLLAAWEGQDPYTYRTNLLDPNNGNAPKGFLGGVSAEHWFGVEPLTGRDLFAIVVYGARTSFLIGVAATALSIVIGVALGLIAGYVGGWVDVIIARTMDVVFSFPSLVFMIAIGVVVPASFPRPVLIVLVLGFFLWPKMGRVIRAQAIALRKREFVEAARTLGAGPWRVIVREILPNTVAPIVVFSTLRIPEVIGLEAALSFLGVGVLPPTPDWGASIAAAVPWIQTDLAYLLFPGGALFIAVLAFNVFGDGLRDALDPRLEKVTRR